jgi:hypothetical protein
MGLAVDFPFQLRWRFRGSRGKAGQSVAKAVSDSERRLQPGAQRFCEPRAERGRVLRALDGCFSAFEDGGDAVRRSRELPVHADDFLPRRTLDRGP